MKRRFFISWAGLLFLLFSCNNSQTELILLGTVHQPVKNFNSDSLYNILRKIEPDLILFEVDSSFFTSEFEFNKTWGSNENIATVRYMNNFEVEVRPYEFTGRNEYRIHIGSRPTDTKALKLLDSLYSVDRLDSLRKKSYENFLVLNDSLNSIAFLGAKAFNNAKTDKIAKTRQQIQYKKLLDIMGSYPIFSSTYHVKNENDSISYYEGFKKASEFWDLRNYAMSRNILHFICEYNSKRIVVLNGYFHRYYLDSLIRAEQDKLGFILKEFYEY